MDNENHGICRGATDFPTTPINRRGRLPESFYSSIHKKPHSSKVKKRKSSAGLGDTSHSRSHRSQEDFSTEFHHNTFPRRKSVECPEDGGGSMRNGDGEVRIGQQYWKGEIGIKSFNYYLLKEGLKTTRNGQKKPPPDTEISGGVHSDGALERMPSFRHGVDENLYEEIYLMAKNEALKPRPDYPDCELCASQWESENKENDAVNESQEQHVLKFQSYNPNNPGIYKTETTPVAFPCDYNPLKTLIMPCPGDRREYSSCESLLREDGSYGRRSARFSDQEHPAAKQRGSIKSVESLTSSHPSCHCGSSDSDCMYFDCHPCPFDVEKCSFSDNTHCQDCDDYVRRRMRRNNEQEIHYLRINQRQVKKSEYWSGSLPHLKRESVKKPCQLGPDCAKSDCRVRTLDRRTTRSSDQFNFLSGESSNL